MQPMQSICTATLNVCRNTGIAYGGNSVDVKCCLIIFCVGDTVGMQGIDQAELGSAMPRGVHLGSRTCRNVTRSCRTIAAPKRYDE